jgi:hypothetical protein
VRIFALLAAVLVTPAAAAELEALRWEMRPLLVFTPAADTPALLSQMAALEAERDGVLDRRIAVYLVTDRVVPALGAPSPSDTAEALRRRFAVPADRFAVVLLGLDGAPKLAEDEPVATDRLFALIDGMPMRREELRRRD